MVLATLLKVYGMVILFNACLSGILLYYTKDKIYKMTFFLWTAALANFVLQGIYQKFDFLMVLAFASYFPCTIFLIVILDKISSRDILTKTVLFSRKLKHNLFLYCQLMAACLVFAWVFELLNLENKFVWQALSIAIGISFPMLWEFSRKIRFFKANSIFVNIFLFLLCCNGFHFLDYPFIRTSQDFSIIGFSVALLLIFGFSITIPAAGIFESFSNNQELLEIQVDQRTQELKHSNAKLNESNKILETLSKENGLLIGMVCHDIANPLMLVIHSTQRLKVNFSKGLFASDLNEKYFNTLARAASVMEESLSQARKIYKLRLENSNLELSPTNLKSAIDEIILLLEPRCEAKGINIECLESNSLVPMIIADPLTLKNQVLTNLISNSIKFSTLNDKITLSIVDGASTVGLSIKDQGQGIPNQILDHIFDVKTSKSQLGTDGEKGTGLGMPIVKNCMDMFHGTIRIYSRTGNCSNAAIEGSGTEVVLTFKKAA